MDEWGILVCVVAAGVGTLAFLKIVGDEVLVKHRVLEMRIEAKEDEIRHRVEKEAAPGVVTEVKGKKSSEPVTLEIDVDAA